MKKYPLYCLLFLGIFNSSAVWMPASKPMVSAAPFESTEEACFLPKVSNLTFTMITTTSVSFTWSPVAGAGYYRIKVYDKVNNDLARNYLVAAQPGTNASTASGLVAGVQYSLAVTPVCANGQESL